MYRLLYIIRHGLKGIAASWLVTAMSTLTISVSLLLIGFFTVFSMNMGDLLEELADRLHITAYLTPDTPEPELEKLKATLEDMEQVTGVRYISPAEIKDEIRDLLGTDFIAGTPDESLPLQPAFEISLERLEITNASVVDVLSFVRALERVEAVDDVVHGVGKYRLLLVLIDAVHYVGLVITLTVILAALFFVYSNVRLSVHARQDEITVMRLVGATNTFIKIPFFLQGGLQGMVGGILSLALVFVLNGHIQSYLSAEISIRVDLMPAGIPVLFLMGGVGLGMLGTWLSVGKYLKT